MDHTIAAIATAMGEGGIGIVRISGGESKKILQNIFIPASDSRNFDDVFKNRRMVYGHVMDQASSETIDEAMAVFMKGPKTYTTEDVVEIYCHGSVISLKKTLRLAFKLGAKPSERGEFTKRAFLNGRLDLSQAEAVMDLISAKTDKAFDVAVSQLEGGLSGEIRKIRASIMDVLVDLTVNLDYPDEDIEELVYDELTDCLMQIRDMIENISNSFSKGRIIQEGLRLVIAGKPNVGKSSLMNALLRQQRAIVTEIPGTTRDTIEELVDIKGIPVKITDTAGIRQTEDIVENIGIQKAKQSFNEADIIVFVIDAAEKLSSEDMEIFSFINPQKSVILLNKSDLGAVVLHDDIKKINSDVKIIESALVQNIGVQELEDVIYDMVCDGKVTQENSVMITNERHKQLLDKSILAIGDSIAAAEEKVALDFIEVDVRHAYELLGEVIGETVSDDVIDEVFKRFCLGK